MSVSALTDTINKVENLSDEQFDNFAAKIINGHIWYARSNSSKRIMGDLIEARARSEITPQGSVCSAEEDLSKRDNEKKITQLGKENRQQLKESILWFLREPYNAGKKFQHVIKNAVEKVETDVTTQKPNIR